MFSKETAPAIITIVVLGGFIGISFLAMKPELAGVKESVVLYLLGAWQSMAAAAVAYWIGSSAGSAKKDEAIAKKDDTISSMATSATAAAAVQAAKP